jgi:putative MATE family efflux protein
MNNDKLQILKSKNLRKSLLQLGIPTMIGMLINACYNLSDAFFVGKLGTDQVGAIGVTFPINQIVIGVGMAFGLGASSYISRLLGEKKINKVNETASTAVFLVMLVQILLVVVSILLLKPLLFSLGATETIYPYAKSYSLIYLLGTPISVFYIAMNNIVTAEGNARLSMTAMIIGNLLNIILDPIFIYVFNWGVSGAALATVISQVITATIYLVYLLNRKGSIHISTRFIKMDAIIIKEILSIGFPIFLFQLLFGISQGLTNSAASLYGSYVVATVGIVIRILSIGTFVVFGFIKGFQPLVGFAYGANDLKRVRDITFLTIKWTSFFCLIFTMLINIFSLNIMSFFSSELSVIKLGGTMLRANSYMFIFFGFQIVISTLFLAIGKGAEGGILSICRNGLFFIPIILLAPRVFSLNGVVYAQVFADACTVLLTILLASKLYRELRRSYKAHSKISA